MEHLPTLLHKLLKELIMIHNLWMFGVYALHYMQCWLRSSHLKDLMQKSEKKIFWLTKSLQIPSYQRKLENCLVLFSLMQNIDQG